MVEAEKTVSVIKKLQSYGIQVALDDFGTGFSSLAYLNSFHINILKIDGSFIKNAILDDTGNIITKSIINMARELKIKLVAEGIEKWEQLSYLLNMNCLMGQGYLYSKPLSYEEFGLVLSKGKCEPFIMDEESRITTEDRRKFFRVKFSKLLEANLTLKEFRGKNVNVGNTKVLVKNIGSGGLCFISNIRIPTEQSVVLQFTTKLTGKEIKLYGSPVWSDTWPGTGTGVPFTAAYIMSKGDPVADLVEDMAAEEKARATYEHLIDLADDPDVIDPLRWLREREVVHFQRFGEILNKIYEWKDSKKYY